MSDFKTKPTPVPVEVFLASVEDGQKRADARYLAAMMADVTGADGRMWGPCAARSRSRRSRLRGRRRSGKRALTIYIMPGFSAYQELLGRLGKHTIGERAHRGCVLAVAVVHNGTGCVPRPLTR